MLMGLARRAGIIKKNQNHRFGGRRTCSLLF
ncbi:hypothetical protein LINPERPRIM_LOCUS22082 [Linum perenne]